MHGCMRFTQPRLHANGCTDGYNAVSDCVCDGVSEVKALTSFIRLIVCIS